MKTIIVFCLLMGSCKGYRQDNALEELAEEFIAEETGLDVDLSPGTPEED